MDTFFFILELLGTLAFAVSGASVGIRKHMDIFGVVILGVVTAVGGGVLRDLVIGINPPRAFQDPVWLITSLVTSAVLFFPFVRKPFAHSKRLVDVVLVITDAAGLGIFATTGMIIAMDQANCHSALLLLFVGLVTGTGGGVLRDVLSGEVPYVFQKHVYALTVLIGAGAFLLLRPVLPEHLAVLVGVGVVVVLRCLAARFRWNLPKAEPVWKNEGE